MTSGLQCGWSRCWGWRGPAGDGRASSRSASSARRRFGPTGRAVERWAGAASSLTSTIWAAQRRSARDLQLHPAGLVAWSGGEDTGPVAGTWVERCTAACPVALRVVVATPCRAMISCLGESCAHLLVSHRLGRAALCVASTPAEPQLQVETCR